MVPIFVNMDTSSVLIILSSMIAHLEQKFK
jgi:hypothetical protein